MSLPGRQHARERGRERGRRDVGRALYAVVALALGGSFGWPGAALALDTPRVGIVGGTKPCRTAIHELLDESIKVVERDHVDGRPSSNDPDAMERWIASSVRPGSVDLVLVVDTMDKDTMRLLAFHGGHMVGLRLVDVVRGCKLPARSAALTRAWLASRLTPPSDPPIDPHHELAHAQPAASPPPVLLVPHEPDEPPTQVHPVVAADAGKVAASPPPKPAASPPPKPAASEPPKPAAKPAIAGVKPSGGRPPADARAPPKRARAAGEPRDPNEPTDPDAGEMREPATLPVTEEAAPAEPALLTGPAWLKLRLGAGLDLVSHTFRWVNPISTNTRELRFDLVPAPRISIDASPFLTGPSLLQPLAAIVRYRRIFGLVARRSEGGKDHPMVAQDFELGVAYPIGVEVSGRALVITPTLVFRDVRFDLGADSAGALEDQLPDATYSSLSPGVAADLALQGRVRLQGKIAYQWVLAIDKKLAQELPDRTIHGLSLTAGIAFAPIENIELTFSMEWLRYFESFAPRADAVRVVSGASDETLSVSAAVAYKL